MGEHSAASGTTIDTREGSSASDKPRIAINDLPPDILLVIFRELLLTVRVPMLWGMFPVGWNDEHLVSWPSYDSSMPRHAFPESIASVCRHWREIMSTLSFFWTRLVIWVGQEPTPLSTIRDYLAWSQDGLLDIYILRTADSSVERDPTEKTQVKDIMEMLVPHMKRWRLLCVKLLHSSSLPLPRIDIVGRANRLVKLKLHFVIDDCVASPEAAPPVIGEFHTPVLEKLHIGGFHFREAYSKPFPQIPMPPRLSYVSISDYDSHLPQFPLMDLLTCLVSCKKMSQVRLANLKLDCSYTGPPIMEHGIDWYADADFVEMGGAVITEYNRLLGYPYVETVSYTRCSLERPAALGESYYINMDEIASPTSLLGFLAAPRSRFSCREVSFTDCDGLSPEVLHMLAMPLTDMDIWLCPNIAGLIIEGCKHFRSSDLRIFVEARRTVHEATGFPEDHDMGYVVTSITELDVQDCCELAPDDREWFNANVETVRWDDWTGGYGSG